MSEPVAEARPRPDRVHYTHKACGTEMTLGRPFAVIFRPGMSLGCTHCDADAELEHYTWRDGSTVTPPAVIVGAE